MIRNWGKYGSTPTGIRSDISAIIHNLTIYLGYVYKNIRCFGFIKIWKSDRQCKWFTIGSDGVWELVCPFFSLYAVNCWDI